MKLQLTLLSILVLLVLGSCEKKSPDPNPTINQSIGDLVFSEFKEVSSARLTANNPATELEVKDGGSKGTNLSISQGAFEKSANVKISEANVVSHKYGNNKLRSPLIKIESDGVNISSGLKLSIPISLEANEFASAFAVTDDGKLHVLPLLNLQATKIEVALFDLNYETTTTSSARTASISTAIKVIVFAFSENELLEKEVSSNYQPGIDDWEFENRGSVMTPDGNCLGMTLSSLWYFQFEKRNSGPLFAQNDWGMMLLPNSLQHRSLIIAPTKDGFWFDNTLGIKLVSILQDQQNTTFSRKIYDYYDEKFGKGLTKPIRDRHMFNLVAHHFAVSNEPMLLSAGRNHAVLVIAKMKDGLLIADPNFPASALKLSYTPLLGFGKLRSAIAPNFYNDYSDFYLLPWRGVLPIENIRVAWSELVAGTIGKPFFLDTEFTAVSEGETTKLATSAINKIKSEFKLTHSVDSICLFKTDGKSILKNSDGNYTLATDVTKIGILSLSKYNNPSTGSTSYRWTDFKWFNVNVEKTEPVVSDTLMITGFKLSAEGFPENSNFSIIGNGRVDSKTFNPMARGFHDMELSLAVGEHIITVDQDQKFFLDPRAGYNVACWKSRVDIGNLRYILEVYHLNFSGFPNAWLEFEGAGGNAGGYLT